MRLYFTIFYRHRVHAYPALKNEMDRLASVTRQKARISYPAGCKYFGGGEGNGGVQFLRGLKEIRGLHVHRGVICSGRPSEPVWPSGKAGKERNLGSNPLRLSFLFESCSLWTLSCDFVPHN